MTFIKIYFFGGLALILWLTWANFRGLNLLDAMTPNVSPGHYSSSGTVFHK